MATYNDVNKKLYGAIQTGGQGVPATLAGDNVIIAMNLTADPNIATKSDALAGGLLDANTVISITDTFHESSFDTYLPTLGDFLGRKVGSLEQYHISASSTTGGSIKFNYGSETTTDITTTTDVTVTLNNIFTALNAIPAITSAYTIKKLGSTIGLWIVAKDSSVNPINLSLNGGGNGVVLNTNNSLGIDDISASLPIAPFLRSASLGAVVDTSWGLSLSLRNKYDIAVTSSSDAIQSYSNALTSLNKIRKTLDSLNGLTLGNGNDEIVDYLVNALVLDLNESTPCLISKLKTAKTDINAFSAAVQSFLTILTSRFDDILNNVSNVTGALTYLKDQTASLKATVNDISTSGSASQLSNVTYNNSSVTLSNLYTTVQNLTTNNSSISSTFNTLKLSILTDLNDVILSVSALQTAVSTALTNLSSANTTVSTNFYPSSLFPAYRSIDFSNTVLSNDTLTLHVRKTSADHINSEKTEIITDARATVDLTIKVTERPMLKFSFHGNLNDTVQNSALTYDIAPQIVDIADVTVTNNIRNCSLSPTGEATQLNNVCFNSLTANNFDGFSHDRTQTGCGSFWLPQRKSHDFTLTIKEDDAKPADPEANFDVEQSMGKVFDFTYTQGNLAGKTLTVTMLKCTLKGRKSTKVGNVSFHDLTLECAGASHLILS